MATEMLAKPANRAKRSPSDQRIDPYVADNHRLCAAAVKSEASALVAAISKFCT